MARINTISENLARVLEEALLDYRPERARLAEKENDPALRNMLLIDIENIDYFLGQLKDGMR